MKITMKEVVKERIDPHSGTAFELRQGQLLKVTAPTGEQVSELICYNLTDPDEWLSSGRTLDHAGAWLIRQGHVLYSNRSRPMLSLLEDSCGRHDFLLAPCSQEMYQQTNSTEANISSCHENLHGRLMAWDIDPDEIYITFKLFMNTQLQADGSLSVDTPASKAGDYVLFRAEMDLVVGLTACAAAQYNNGTLKHIEYEIIEE
ncbi:DUF1989 domain-containing protein [Cesiribacter andamanensis]|uniref:Urea carboxylase-associated protein 1 n=1 Tax=Cesiribacter andamanensis AMV16 TaxID=1279009 RepID=M7NAW2_9BACT|nr:urea carboxylase-associated family protein [Cesiribacter andamanensis]EMR04311.1 urea carboxylase-associated protein 1 [Cesiribacter andamanensis AMV16]